MASVKDLRDSRDRITTVYAKYLKNLSSGIRFHFFVEGEDDPSFYLHAIASCGIDIRETMIYKCKNKDGVLAVYYKLSSLKDKMSNTFFLKDRDYDDYVEKSYGKSIYSTDGYSIESEMVGENILIKLWMSEIRGLPIFASTRDFTKRWRESLKSFLSNFGYKFYAALIYMQKNDIPYNLDKLDVVKMLNTKADGRVLFKRGMVSKSISDISELDPRKLRSVEILNIVASLKEEDPKKFVVGKHLLSIFSKYVDQYINLRLRMLYPKIRYTTQINVKSPQKNFCHLVDIPQTLRVYIDNRRTL